MIRLNNFIFKKHYYSLIIQNIFLNFPYLVILKYDSITSSVLNKFRMECIIHSLKIYLVNSKYIDSYFFKCGALTSLKFLKNDVLLIPFVSIESLKVFIFDKNLSCYLDFFKMIGFYFNGNLLNLRFPSLYKILKNDNNFFNLCNFFSFLFNVLIHLFKVLIYLLINVFNLFIFTLSLCNKSNKKISL